MKTTLIFNKGYKIGSYTLAKCVGKGGNGEVWSAVDDRRGRVAIKFLTRLSSKRRHRFYDEIAVVTKNSDIGGILPILESYLPSEESVDTPFYVMPLAKPLIDVVDPKEPRDISKHMCQLADTLVQLHERGISHRDIKPANLLFHEGRVCLSDFGLADFPDKQDITAKGEDIGPRWTIAPEMRRDSKNADGLKADTYSFAKTLWIMLTNKIKGFDGQYFSDTVLSLKNYTRLSYYKGLDDLLRDCTSNDPDQRPTSKEVLQRLSEWIKVEGDHQVCNRLRWKDVQKELFPSGTPTRAIWQQTDAIVSILQRLSTTDDLNHMFFPNGGGMNLLNAKRSYEDQCIEMDVGWTLVVKPKRLVFESFDFKEEWNYFRLETSRIAPTGYYEKVGNQEPLTEITPATYSDIKCWEFNDYNGKDLPQGTRQVVRVLEEGSFVIFQNLSRYNKIGDTYDARHNKMSTDEFRTYIGKAVRVVSSGGDSETDGANAPYLVKPDSFKSKRRLLTSDEVTFLREVAVLAREREIEELELHKKSGMGEVIDFSNTDFFSASRPKSDRLKAYLKGLSQSQIVFIAAVTYGGRDGIPPLWGTPLDELISEFGNRSDLILSICEKLPLATYLERGIAIYTLDI